MALIRHNSRLLAVLGAFLVVLLSLFVGWPTDEARAGADAAALPATTWASIQELRCRAGLDDSRLTCVNLSDAQLDAALGGVRTWHAKAGSAWELAEARAADQRAAVRRLHARCIGGENVASELAAAQRRYAALEAELAATTADCAATVLSELSADQRAVLERLWAGVGIRPALGLLDLTDEQTDTHRQAERRFRQRCGAVNTSADAEVLVSTYQSEQESIIGSANGQRLAALRAYRGAASARVVAAIRRVLPMESTD